MAFKKKKKDSGDTASYVCIRECFDRGRVWTTIGKAVRKKDYFLEVDKDEKVSPKNFMKVEKDPGLEKKKEEKPKALSTMQNKPGDEFLT